MQHERKASGNPFFDNKESEQHSREIERLSRELNLPSDDVRRSYPEILEKFRKEAKVRVFLSILVSKSVKERLRQK